MKTLDETLEETPYELIRNQSIWRRDYMNDIKVFNNYYYLPHNIRTIPEFDPRPLRHREWTHLDDLRSRPVD